MMRPALVFAAVLLVSWAARAELRMMESFPAAHAVMSGANHEFFVRFDHPVDHHAARLTLLRDGTVVRELTPRLRSQPNTLFAAVGPLPQGEYALRWRAHAATGPDDSDGEVRFSVR
jgi:methionine-rich copper-binding protein CopC